MPVLDGIEVTRQLSATYPDVAIVVLTTYADDSSVLAALRAGARSFLTKDAIAPISPTRYAAPPPDFRYWTTPYSLTSGRRWHG